MREEGKRLEGNQPAPDAKEKEKWTLKRFWKEWKEVVYVLAAVFVVFKFILQIAWVPSGSMETTLPTRSVLLGWHLTYAVADPMQERGDIITFWSDELGKVLVKRVIGLPGDEITFSGGYVYINGQQLDEPYLPAQGVTDCDRTFTVPEGCFFPLGDNRTGSLDARSWENPYIPASAILARPFVVISVGSSQSWQGIRLIKQGGAV